MKSLYISLFFTINLLAQDILILNSYSPSLQWTKEQSDSIVKNLQRIDNHKLFIEYMDTKVFKLTKETEENLLNYYKNKYKNISFKAVITTDDNALNFVIKYKEVLFKDSKVFFSGVNNLTLKEKLDKNIYAGVFEEKDPISNLNIAIKSVKNLKTIYLLADNSLTAQKEIEHYKSKLSKFSKYKYIYLNSHNIEDILKGLETYESNSVMMLLVFTGFNQNSKHINYKKALTLISKVYENPMLIHTSVYINTPNTNIIAGNCTDGKTAGLQVSQYILRYLYGIPMKELGFSNKQGNKVYVNVRNLNRYQLDVKDLNLYNPILVNEMKTFYDLYKKWIIIFILIVTLIIIFILIVAKKNNVLMATSREIETLNSSLELKVQHALSKLKEQHMKHEEERVKNTKFATIGQMAAGITHEINTPLTYIKGNVEMSKYDLEDMPDNNFKQRLLEDNQKVMNGINRMAIIVESMREMSQVTPTIREETNIYATLITVLRMTYNRTKLVSEIYVNNQLFDLEKSDKQKYKFIAKVHKQRIEQVWTIILNNALDELVKIDNFDNRRIDIDIFSENENIIVTICDNAGGVSKELDGKIFEPFVSTKESSGIGIGLNVAKKILDEHNANIDVENKKGGACFTIIL